jgi:hypothetical protein
MSASQQRISRYAGVIFFLVRRRAQRLLFIGADIFEARCAVPAYFTLQAYAGDAALVVARRSCYYKPSISGH